MRTRTTPSVIVGVLLVALVGCTNEPHESVLQVDPLPVDAEIHLTTGDKAPLMLIVSNQSFEDDPVHLTLSIDGVPLIDGVFYVGNQHAWLSAPIDLPPGEHTMVATSDTGVTLTETFDIPADAQRWAILDYWYYPREKAGRHLRWDLQRQQPAFG